jgi:hypothetical protein
LDPSYRVIFGEAGRGAVKGRVVMTLYPVKNIALYIHNIHVVAWDGPAM